MKAEIVEYDSLVKSVYEQVDRQQIADRFPEIVIQAAKHARISAQLMKGLAEKRPAILRTQVMQSPDIWELLE